MKKIIFSLVLMLVGLTYAEQYKLDQFGYIKLTELSRYFTDFAAKLQTESDEDLIARVQKINEVKIRYDHMNNLKQYDEAEDYLRDQFHMQEANFKKMIRIVETEVDFRIELGKNEENPISYLANSQARERQEKAERDARVQQGINVAANFLEQTGDNFSRVGEAYMDY